VADEHRVEFDFELEFTNGGALQGQGFRLRYCGLPGISDLDAVVVNLAGSRRPDVDRAQLLPYDLGGKAVLVHMDVDPPGFLTADAAEHLAAAGALLVGVDWHSIDHPDEPDEPARSILLRAGIPICENLTNLGALPTSGAGFSAVPVKIDGIDTSPVRAYATLSAGQPDGPVE
jgi:arylformamidase